jgi:hypothetical protein
MATTDLAPNDPGTSTSVTTGGVAVADEQVCPACAHPWDAHDVIGTRFCTATVAGALTRGCACRT